MTLLPVGGRWVALWIQVGFLKTIPKSCFLFVLSGHMRWYIAHIRGPDFFAANATGQETAKLPKFRHYLTSAGVNHAQTVFFSAVSVTCLLPWSNGSSFPRSASTLPSKPRACYIVTSDVTRPFTAHVFETGYQYCGTNIRLSGLNHQVFPT
jgi:hypothetical protein